MCTGRPVSSYNRSMLFLTMTVRSTIFLCHSLPHCHLILGGQHSDVQGQRTNQVAGPHFVVTDKLYWLPSLKNKLTVLRNRTIPHPQWCKRRAPRIIQCSAAGSDSETVRVIPPPSDYDFRAAIAGKTRSYIQRLHPELLDLVDEGTLVVVERPSDYVERRSDGYREPEVVYVIGTAHVSRQSAAEVERVVAAVRPQNVVVELCRSRAGTMYNEASEENGANAASPAGKASNVMALTGDSFGSAIGRSLQLGGRSALALRLLLGGLSQRVSASAGVQSGEEFRAARRAAEAIHAQLVLGDRPIEITLQRAWQALSWREKVKLCTALWQGAMSAKLDASEETLQALKSDDVLSTMFAELSAQFPSLVGPLIHERDVYLAWSLKRSKAVNGCERVVGVLGRGHLRGVVYALTHNQEKLRFKDLVGPRKKSGTTDQLVKFTRNLAIETAIGGLIWFVFVQLFSGNNIN